LEFAQSVCKVRHDLPGKNILHGKGIQDGILDLRATIPIRFVFADGIVAMEGNGPLTAPLALWERAYLRTIRWLPIQHVRG